MVNGRLADIVDDFAADRWGEDYTAERTLLFFSKLQIKYDCDHVMFLVDDAHYLEAALSRLGLRFQVHRHGNRNHIERVFREVERRTSSFANTFRNTPLGTAEAWLQAFAVWYNAEQR